VSRCARSRSTAAGLVWTAAARCFLLKTLDAHDIRADASYRELDPALLEALVVGRPISEA
jgi:hypothetical protein